MMIVYIEVMAREADIFNPISFFRDLFSFEF